MNELGKRVVVAMSGGVDSSTTAALLAMHDYDVIGITMQIWMNETSREDGCCSLSAVEDARRVAQKIGIPYYVMNLKDEFRRQVIDNFCEEYKRGRTPNPCVRCNQFIKFKILQQKAEGFGAGKLATGHYAQIEFDTKQNRWLLKKGRDARKDQSYFLYTLTQEQLCQTLMPLGKLTKEQTRRLAKEFKFHVYNKKESQEICFVPDNNYNNFVREYLKGEITPGPIIDQEGRVMGEHKGIHFYTVGQRKGLNLAPRGPYYVIKIDAPNNTLVVGDKAQTYGTSLTASNLNFISIEKLAGPMKVGAKVRYNSEEAWASIEPIEKNRVKVEFTKPQLAITPGQSVVFYDGEVVVGGGLIE